MLTKVFQIMLAPATLACDSATLIWSSRNFDQQVTKFQVYKNDELVACRKKNQTHYTAADLEPATSYLFRIDALQNEETVASATVSVTTKAASAVLDVTEKPYLADGSGKKLSTAALQQAIDDCPVGGTVLIPAGTKVISGAIELKSNMILQVDGVLQGSSDPLDYTIEKKQYPGSVNQDGLIWTRYEGWELYCYRSLLNAGWLNRENRQEITCSNIRICGIGRIIGGGNELGLAMRQIYWDIEKYPEYLSDGRPGRRVRGRLLSFIQCHNVHITGVSIENPPSWTIHMIYCDTITTNDVSIISKGIDNGDGWDPDSSRNMLIFDTRFDTGDDCIAIKSGKNPEGNTINLPTENVWIFDLEMTGGNGMAIGSEMSGGVSNIQLENCRIENTNYGLDIKAHVDRGGYIRNVTLCNCSIDGLNAHSVDYNTDGKAAEDLPAFENISLHNCQITDPMKSIKIHGFQKGKRRSPVRNILLENVSILGSVSDLAKIELSLAEEITLRDVTLSDGSAPMIEKDLKTTKNIQIQ